MLKLHFKNVLGFSKKIKSGFLQIPQLNINNLNLIKISKIYFSEDKKNQGKEKNKNEKPKEKAGAVEKVPPKGGPPVANNDKQGKKNNLEKAQASKKEVEEEESESESSGDEDLYKPVEEGEEEFIEYTDKIKELLRPKQVLKNETYKIVHHHDKAQNKTRVNKKSLENLVTTLLRNEEITQQRAEEIKTEIRDPLNNAYGRHLTKIKHREDLFNYIQNFSDLYFYTVTFKNMDRIMRYQRELREMSDPNFIQVRSQHKLVKNEDMQFLVPETTDVRQNVNSADWLKPQPRMYDVGYNYNAEHHREFHTKFKKYVEEDKQKVLERQKLWKYIKLNPNDQQVKSRFIPKLLPNGVTPDMIPDYDVDITGYRPKVTKKSRRKYNAPRIDTNITNYQCWRCFDRFFSAFSHEYPCIRVNLIPKNLIARFGPPGVSQHPDFTGMYYFEDENLDVFLVGDYQQTQITWGFNYTEEFYEEQEKTVKPDWRVKKWPTCHEFWESTEPKEFKIYYLRYSELHKFKRWLKVYVNSFDANVDKSMDQILDEKFGPMDDYTDYSMQRTNDSVPAIHHYGAKYFLEKDEKLTIYRDPFNPPKYISPSEGEMFDYEQYLKEEAQKGLKRVDQEMAGEEEKI